MNKEIMTVDELAEYLKISKATLYVLLMRRLIPGTKVGKRWRFRKDRIDKWLIEKEVGGRKRKKSHQKLRRK